MAEPSTRPGAVRKFTRRKLGEKLYLQSSGFDLRDPNCHTFRPTYYSLHDPNLKQHFHRRDIHNNLKERHFITDDDMVTCTQKEYNMYHDYVEDIKNGFKTKQLRERQRNILELKEQGLISEDVSLEDIRMFLQTNKLPRHDEHQPELGQPKRSTKKTMKEKDVSLNKGQFPNTTPQRTCIQDRTQLHLIEQEVKHEFNRNKYLREIQEKRSRREKIILERRAVTQQTEMNKLMKTLRDLEKMGVFNEDQTKHIFCESTSAEVPLEKPMQRRPTLKRLPPLPARGHDLSNQQTSSSDSKLSPSSDTAHSKSHCLGKMKLPNNQHNPEANKNARITQDVLDYTISTATQNQGEIVEAISSPTVNREDTAGEILDHGRSFGLADMAVFQSKEKCEFISLKEPEASRPHISSGETETLAGASSAPFVSSSFLCGVMCQPLKDTMVTSQMSQEKSVLSSSMIGQLHSAQSFQSKETQLCMPSVAPDTTCSDASVPVSGKGVYTITKSQSFPSFNREIANRVIQHVTSTVCKDKIIQTVRNDLKRSFSVNDLQSAPHLRLGPDERKSVRSMFERVSKDLNNLLSREHILPLFPIETTGSSPDQDALVTSQLNVAASQVIETVFSEVKQQLTTKITQESPMRGVSPLGCQTAINAICTSLEGMKRTVSNEMFIVFESEMLLPVNSEDTRVDSEMSSAGSLSAYEVEILAGASTALFTASISPISVAGIKDKEGGLVPLQVAEPSAPEISPKEIESPADASADLSGVPSSTSKLEVFKTEEYQPVISQEDEVFTQEISTDEVETLADASTALSTASISLNSVADIMNEKGGSVPLQVAEPSSPEITPDEIEPPADAIADLCGVPSSTSKLQVFKTEEHQPVISQEDEVSTSKIYMEEVETLADASTAFSTASVSPGSVAGIKDEEGGAGPLQVAEPSAPEISLKEIESPADASADLSGIPSSMSKLQVFKTEEHQPVISQVEEVFTQEISTEEVEILADASSAPSSASISPSSVAGIKDEEGGAGPLQVAEPSAPEISLKEIESPADASADLSGIPSSMRKLEVFKTEGSHPVTAQVTREISSNKVEILLDASSTPCFAPSFAPSAAEGGPTCSGTNQVPVRKKKCTAIKSLSLPSLYPAIADEVGKYFTTTSFKDRITHVVKNELKRSFSVNNLSSTPHPKLGPEERKAIRNMLKRVSKELDDLMSREHILSLLSAAENTGYSSPEHDALLAQLNAAASRLIDEVFNEVKVKLATKIKQESPKRDVSPVASQVAIKAACRSLEDIKRSLLGDEICVASTSGIRLSVSSADTKVAPETSNASNFRTENKIPSPPTSRSEPTVLPEANVPSARSLRFQNSTSNVAAVSKTPHAATKSLSISSFYPTVVKEVLQHVNTTSFKDHVLQVVQKEYKRSLSMNDVRPAPHQTLGPEERRFIKDMLNNVSSELSASMTRHCVLPLSPETAMPPSASDDDDDDDDTLRRLNAVALELIHGVYIQVKEKLTVAIKQESPKRGLSPVASQTAVNAACRTLSAIEVTLMDGVRSPSTPPLQLRKSRHLKIEMASDETWEVQNSLSSVSDDLIEDVISMFYMDTFPVLSSRTVTPTQGSEGGTLFNTVVNQSITMPPTGSKECSTESSDDTSASLTVGPYADLLSSTTDEILQHFSTTCFKECIVQSVKNEVRQRVSGVSQDCMVHIKDMMEIIVKSTFQKMVLHLNKEAPDSLIVEYDMTKHAVNELPALGLEGHLSTQELASTIKQITIAVLNHLKTQLCNQILQKHSSQEESELATNGLNHTLTTMVEYVSDIQFFKEELQCYISKINNIPTQKTVGQWVSLSKLDFVSICLATSVIDNVYYSDSSTNPSSTASPELEANSPLSECLMAPSKPASPTNNRSFRARKWLSSSALEKSADTNPVTAVRSETIECLLRTDMQGKNDQVQLESSSKGTMSKSSSVASLEEKRSRVCSPLPNRLRSSRTLTNLKDEMRMDSILQPKPPSKKSNQSFQQLPDETKKTLRGRKVKIHTIYRNPEGLSDDESSCTSCSFPEDIQSDDASSYEEGPSVSPPKRHST